MCGPGALAFSSFMIGAVQSVAEYQAQEDQYEQNKKNSIAAFEDRQRALNHQTSQERDIAALDKFDNSLQAREHRATSAVAAGEAGISGLSIDALMRDISGTEGRYNSRVDTQTDWTVGSLEQDKRTASTVAKSRIDSVSKPSLLGTGLKIGAAGVSSYAEYDKWFSKNKLNNPRRTPSQHAQAEWAQNYDG